MAQLKQLVTQYDSSSRKQFAAQYIETGAGITGTGDIDIGTESVVGTVGSETVGVGIVDTGTADVSGAIDLGQPAITGTGDINTGKEDVAGVVTMSPLPEISGSGAIDVGSADAAGTATIDSLPTISGAGSVDTGAADVDGVIAADPLTPITATGAVGTKGADITGIVTMTALPTLDGSGAVDVGDAGVSGVVDVQPIPPITGAGDIEAGEAGVSGEISKGPIPPITGGGQIDTTGADVSGTTEIAPDYHRLIIAPATEFDPFSYFNLGKIEKAYVGDSGILIAFVSKYDLRWMQSVRLYIRKPSGALSIRNFNQTDYMSVNKGDQIKYRITSDDLNEPGLYGFQVIAKNQFGEVALPTFPLFVERRLSPDPFAT